MQRVYFKFISTFCGVHVHENTWTHLGSTWIIGIPWIPLSVEVPTRGSGRGESDRYQVHRCVHLYSPMIAVNRIEPPRGCLYSFILCQPLGCSTSDSSPQSDAASVRHAEILPFTPPTVNHSSTTFYGISFHLPSPSLGCLWLPF